MSIVVVREGSGSNQRMSGVAEYSMCVPRASRFSVGFL